MLRDSNPRAFRSLRGLLAREATTNPPAAAPTTLLSVLQASVGNSIRMVPLDEVVFIEAADKYLRVLTASHEYLLRTPLKELLLQLDAHVFWQIHRATLVNVNAIEGVTRDIRGRHLVMIKGRSDRLEVSRSFDVRES